MCTSHAMPILCLVHCGNSATIASGSHREGVGQRALHSGGGGAPSSYWTSRKRKGNNKGKVNNKDKGKKKGKGNKKTKAIRRAKEIATFSGEVQVEHLDH